MGLKVVDGDVYVSEKHAADRARSTPTATRSPTSTSTVATWPFGGNFHEFAFGLLYQDGFFYLNLSVVDQLRRRDHQPAAGAEPRHHDQGQQGHRRGRPTSPAACAPRTASAGARRAASSSPTTRAAGCRRRSWCTSSRAGSSTTTLNPAGPFDASPVTQPVLWMPQNEIANSPSTPLYMTSGLYAGQFAHRRRHLRRPAARRTWRRSTASTRARCSGMTQGLEAGVSEVSLGPDGAIYVGGLGAGGNWGQAGKLSYGLQKLTPNGSNTFDMLGDAGAVATGFEIEYTQPLSAATADRPGHEVPGQAVALRADRRLRRPEGRRGDADGHLGDAVAPTARRSPSHRRPAGRPGRAHPLAAAVRLRRPASRCGAPRPGTRSTPSPAGRARARGPAPTASTRPRTACSPAPPASPPTTPATPASASSTASDRRLGHHFDVVAPRAGAYDLCCATPTARTRSRTGEEDEPLRRRSAPDDLLPPLGDWKTWGTHTVRVNLPAGVNTVGDRLRDR